MDNDKCTKEYREKWQNVKLSDASRSKMEKSLLEYARFHGVKADANESVKTSAREQVRETEPGVFAGIGKRLRASFLISRDESTTEPVRDGEASRLIKGVPHGISLFTRLNLRSMPTIAIVVALVIGGGTSFAAEGSLPGDLLYPVKVGINENVKGSLALGSEAEARLQARLLEERVREAEELKAEGRLEGELALNVESNIETQAGRAEAASNESRASVAVDTRSRVRLALARFNTLIGGSLALENDASMTMEADESGRDAAYGTSMMTMKEVVVAELRPQTEVRINGLLEVIERHEAQFEADMYTELIAQLEDGLEILERSKTETEEEAKNSVITAADVAGGVEGTLSTIGTVTINEETGAIIDIDLSKKPEPIEYPILIDPMPVTDPAFGGGSSQGGTGAGGGVSGSAGMDVDISDDMIEGTFNAGLDATSDLDI